MFDAVIFDWDGTLADTRRVIVLSFQKALETIGCKVSDEFIERRIGIGARNMFKEILKTARIPFDNEMIERLVEKKIRIQTELTGNVELFDGAVELLEALRRRVKLALATMSNRRTIDKVLREKGIRRYFDFVITEDEVSQPKPNPEIFLKCAARLRCPVQRCVVIEDSIFGVKAAKEAGMKCVAVPSGAYSVDELKKERPDLIVRSIKEKEKILNFILGEDKGVP
ncbi:MAG: HAD-superfamily hydrolase [Candidatus Bathyarchaeota archaeon B26-2]|nr:MAG: HAD-superfamily hydrolase [Candidatus Bathyarchaeota archaeon B26-2]